MTFSSLPLAGVYLVEPEVFSDNRGSFSRLYCEKEFNKIKHNKPWVQINHSCTIRQGSIRGMHFQFPPHSEIKLVKCVVGRIFDVVIDIRSLSPTFLQWTGVELSATNGLMLYIPEGFAHGFQTLTDNCEIIYQVSEFYTKISEGGIRWDDPLININWPVPLSDISERDKQHELITEEFSGIKNTNDTKCFK